MRRTPLALLALTLALGAAKPAAAGLTYVALGDSITFGETDLKYVPSFGDRGYVARYADALAARNGGVRPNVVNLAIDGETAESFLDATGRTPPVVGRTDPILAAQNKNYAGKTSVPQGAMFQSRVAAERAAGNTIGAVTVSLGFNELAALAPPTGPGPAGIPAALAAYEANYRSVLAGIRAEAPDADLTLLNYYNPFPADPASPAAPVFDAGGAALDATIKGLAAEFHAGYADAFTPFVGHEAAYTYLDEMPHGSTVGDPYGGVLPVGNVHPNDAGYAAIAGEVSRVSAVPLPPAVAMALPAMAMAAAWGWLARRRRSAA